MVICTTGPHVRPFPCNMFWFKSWYCLLSSFSLIALLGYLARSLHYPMDDESFCARGYWRKCTITLFYAFLQNDLMQIAFKPFKLKLNKIKKLRDMSNWSRTFHVAIYHWINHSKSYQNSMILFFIFPRIISSYLQSLHNL